MWHNDRNQMAYATVESLSSQRTEGIRVKMSRIAKWPTAVSWLLSLALACTLSAQAAPPPSPSADLQTISRMEQDLLSQQFNKDTVEARLSRLEETVFGEAQRSLSPSERVGKLQAVLMPYQAPPMANGQPAGSPPPANAIAPQPGGKTPLPNQTSKSSSVISQPIYSGQEEAYPAVTEMERNVLGRTFNQEDITQRIERLEMTLFKRVQPGALVDRTDNLWVAVFGTNDRDAFSAQAAGEPSKAEAPPVISGGPTENLSRSAGQAVYDPKTNTYVPPGGDTLGSSSAMGQSGAQSGAPYGAASGGAASPDLLAGLSQVEQDVLKETYPMEPVEVRLDRLETKIFQRTSPELSSDERLQRVIAVAAGGGDKAGTTASARPTWQIMLPIILTLIPLLL